LPYLIYLRKNLLSDIEDTTFGKLFLRITAPFHLFEQKFAARYRRHNFRKVIHEDDHSFSSISARMIFAIQKTQLSESYS